MIAHKGLNGYVIFMGVVKDIIPYISQMDMIILPSLWEGLPNVLLEAMAAGLPVVASRINGIDEVVVDGKTGILCKPGDPQSLAEALLKIFADRGLAEAMGRDGKNRALKNFTINKTVNDTETIYQELLKRHRGQRNAH
jgi:glycosyltransferase involved in cell wall biosynthesis